MPLIFFIIIILSIVVILIITNTTLAIIISTLSIGLILHFSIITSAVNIYYTYKIKDSNVKVVIYII